MLPKINSLRTKELKLNNKIILLKPWNNLQLVNFESVKQSSKEFRYDLLKKYLIDENIECKTELTLIEEKAVLIELYKLSKSNLLDVIFHCDKCENNSSYTINLEKIVKYEPLKSRTIKTKDCIFNLHQNSSYRMNLNNDINLETLKYLASFIESVDYKDKTFEIVDIEECAKWLDIELEKDNFEALISEFDKIQNKILFDVKGTCEFCGHSQELKFKGIEDFLE